MKITAEIKEPQLLNIQSISDDRGLLIPFTDDIDHSMFHRCYYVENYGKGVIRGLHYHKEEVKIFTMASGAAKFITFKLPEAIADRNDSIEIAKYANENPTSIRTWIISNRHHAVLFIPAYYANGWISLEEHSVLIGLSNLRFEKAKNDDLRIDPYCIGENYWKVIGR
jgi:dTDP-4-dehydrorhamnose 3,5-epimerase-like enzyme